MPADSEPPLVGAHLQAAQRMVSERVLDALHRAGYADLRPAHMAILPQLWPAGRRVTDLASRARITKASVVYLVDHLKQLGYVERVPDPLDGRAVLIRLTERGEDIHRVAREAVQQVQDEWAAEVGRAEMARFLATLARISGLPRPADQSDIDRRDRGRRPGGR